MVRSVLLPQGFTIESKVQVFRPREESQCSLIGGSPQSLARSNTVVQTASLSVTYLPSQNLFRPSVLRVPGYVARILIFLVTNIAI